MENVFKNKSENVKLVSDWLQHKMNQQFNSEINLSREYAIDIDGSGLIIPTEGLSKLNYEQKSYLSTMIRSINSREVSFEEMNSELNL